MEENMVGSGETNSIAYLNKKRKLQDELIGMPLPKQLCWGQRLEYEISPDLTIEPKKVKSSIFAGGGESGRESASFSYSFPDDADSPMSSHDDAKTYLSYPKTHASVEPATSSTCCDGTSSQIGLYSSESRMLMKASSSKSESSSICEELDFLHHDYGLQPSDNYEDHLLEFGVHADCSFSEYQNNGVEQCTDKDVDDLLHSNGAAASNYVLSSGRWSANQDSQEGTKKLTIDKEFEQYFSMLMLWSFLVGVLTASYLCVK